MRVIPFVEATSPSLSGSASSDEDVASTSSTEESTSNTTLVGIPVKLHSRVRPTRQAGDAAGKVPSMALM